MVVGRRRRLSAAAAAALVRVCSFSERERDEAIRNDVVDVVDAFDGGLLWWTQGKKTLSKRKKTLSTLSCGKGPRKQECIVVVVA